MSEKISLDSSESTYIIANGSSKILINLNKTNTPNFTFYRV